MNRRGFLTSLAALATTAALPKVPAIRVAGVHPVALALAHNAIYGKMGYQGGRVLYAAADGIITTDIFSAYPTNFERVRSLWKSTDAEVYRAFKG